LLDKIEAAKIPELIANFTIEFYDVYQVKFKYYSNELRYFQFGILEIQSFKKINNYQQLKEQLVNFKNQLKATLNIVIDYKSDLEIIDQLIELQDLQNKILEGDPLRKQLI
jgi:glutaredoxin 2